MGVILPGVDLFEGRLVGEARDGRQELALDRRGAGDEIAALPEALVAVEVGDSSSGLADEEHAGGEVPGGEAKLEEAIVDARGGVGQIEGGGAAAANRPGLVEDGAKNLQVTIQGPAGFEGISGGEDVRRSPSAGRSRKPRRPVWR